MNSTLMYSAWGRSLGKKLMRARQKMKPENDCSRWNIVTGDKVQVIQGPQTGQSGTVLDVLRKANRIIIEGVNMRRRNIKPRQDGTPGKIVVRPCTVHYSNVMLLDPSTGEPTKISRRFLEDGTKVRISKKSGQIIPKPDPLINRKIRSSLAGPKDTAPADVFEVTFPDYEKFLPYIYASRRTGENTSSTNNLTDTKA